MTDPKELALEYKYHNRSISPADYARRMKRLIEKEAV